MCIRDRALGVYRGPPEVYRGPCMKVTPLNRQLWFTEVQMICICSSRFNCHPIISRFSRIQNRLPFWCWLTLLGCSTTCWWIKDYHFCQIKIGWYIKVIETRVTGNTLRSWSHDCSFVTIRTGTSYQHRFHAAGKCSKFCENEFGPQTYSLSAIIRPHRSTTHVDAAHCYTRNSVVCLSVCLSPSWALRKRLNRSICHFGCELGWAKGSR